MISPDTGVNYDRLQKLLADGKWEEANSLTYTLMLKAAGREAPGWLDLSSIKSFPCSDLKIIDSLWKEYSQGRFGFSVQLPIFINTGNKPGKLVGSEAYESFGDRVGWRKDGQWIIFLGNLNYSLDAPAGELPTFRSQYQIQGGRMDYTTFAQRIVECKLEGSPASNSTKIQGSGQQNQESEK